MYICGQKNLTQTVDRLVYNGRFPRFSILQGPTGFGKKVLCEYISKKLDAMFIPCETKIDGIREIIDMAYDYTSKTVVYMFADCDDLSVGAANALLKITEEPPRGAYILMTVSNLNNVLPTLISRATILTLDSYSDSDISEYIEHKKLAFEPAVREIVEFISACPNDVMLCTMTDIERLDKLADTFVNNIGLANLGNELKIAGMLKTKDDDDDKLNPVLFMRCIMKKCSKACSATSDHTHIQVCEKLIRITSNYIHAVSTKGANKQMELDNWIIDCHIALGGAY